MSTEASAFSPFKPIGTWFSWREADEKAKQMSEHSGQSWEHVKRDDGLWAIQRQPWR